MKIIQLLLPALSLFASACLHAATVQVDWVNPDRYSDIRPDSSDTNASVRQRVFSQLEEQLTKLADKLPKGQKLQVRITDVKLAGTLRALKGAETRRVIQANVYPARLEFDWYLIDADGKPLKSGHDRTTSTTATVRTARDEAYGIEKKLLIDWFNETF